MDIHELLSIIPKDQQDRVFAGNECEINYDFLGFTEVYKNLAAIIPDHFTVVDLGCGYNAQCFYFSKHKKYIAVDISKCEKFRTDNCDIFEMTIENFIKKNLHRLNMDETFAICSYVPPWGGDNMKIARDSFKCLFTYYPHGGPTPQLDK